MKTHPIVVLATLILAGCATPPNDGTTAPRDVGGPRGDVVVRDDIEYRGDVLVMESFPVQLRGTVAITNRGNTARTVVFPDGCVALLRAYRLDEADPIWDQASEVACTMALVEMRLQPGESQDVQTPTARGYDILGGRLPDGRYRITIHLRPDQGSVEVEGGTVDLAIPR